MSYIVTGGTGFIGRFLVERLLERDGDIHLLVREVSLDKLERLMDRWGPASRERVHPLVGDLSTPRLGVDPAQVTALDGTVDHVFHLAAMYELESDPAAQSKVNVQGTRHALQLADAVGAGCVHHVSSIAAAGRYPGRFREDMFEEATGLDHAYFRTKHASEQVVRTEYDRPWRIYRPGIVVGHSQTGEMDKIDGPYHFFPALKRLALLPRQLPLLGIEADRVYLVPVDYVAAALDHIGHAGGWDGKTFHLVEPKPPKSGEVINAFCRAAGAPQFPIRLDARASRLVPRPLRTVVTALPPVHRVLNTVRHGLGIPKQTLAYVFNPTRFDTTNAQTALAGSGITCPSIDDYADVLWDYWERELEPAHAVPGLLSKRDRIARRTIVVTGASSGIGRETALQLGRRRAKVILVARSREDLEQTRKEIEVGGGEAHVHPADLSDLHDAERVVAEIIAAHKRVDVLVNNAGISIRRGLELSYDRIHDFQRTMQINYFGALRLILGFVPGMRERGYGQVINVSSIGVQTNQPRFSAYVASKAALDAFSRAVATEVVDDGVAITTIYMPLVRTPMIAPTNAYRMFPALAPEEAAEMILRAIRERPKRVATTLGNIGEVGYAIAPKAFDALANYGYRLFPDSPAARGESGEHDTELYGFMPERRAFAYLFRGIHW